GADEITPSPGTIARRLATISARRAIIAASGCGIRMVMSGCPAFEFVRPNQAYPMRIEQVAKRSQLQRCNAPPQMRRIRPLVACPAYARHARTAPEVPP